MNRIPRYVPILKNGGGELTALRYMAEDIAEICVPLIDFVPRGNSGAGPGGRPGKSSSRIFEESVEGLLNHWSAPFDLIVDAHSLFSTEPWNPTSYMVDGCMAAHMAVIPAVRLSDPRRVLREVGAAVRRACHQPICIRLTEDDLAGTKAYELPARVDTTVRAVRKDPDSIHLVIDLGAITDAEDARHKARTTRLALPYVPHIDDWMSITVAGGAFPQDLSKVPLKTMTRLERTELAFWRAVSTELTGKYNRAPAFGDYAVAFPRQTAGGRYSAPPQLRYTVDNGWLVMKYRRHENDRFFDICEEITKCPDFTPGLTWGDEEIEARGHPDRPPSAPGPGNSSTWRAIGTSHHVGYLAAHLPEPDDH